MNELIVDRFSIKYDTRETEQCPVRINDYIYIENKDLPCYFIGETTLTFFEFYEADCSGLQEIDYRLSEKFKQIISRFPHTNQKKIVLNDEGSYSIKNVPIYIKVKDYILALAQPGSYPKCNSKIMSIQSLTPVFEEEVSNVISYKRKRLFIDGTYGIRELLEANQEKNVQMIQNKLEYVSEMYSFAHYSYAAMVQFSTEYDIMTYDQFHEAYGKYIYSFTITKNGETVPLLWPDYLYHKPENHLEFGLLANTDHSRYRLFDQWEKNDKVTIDILADGFEDVHFETRLKQPMIFPPKLSKSEYTKGETITLSIDPGVVQELAQQKAIFELVKSKKTSYDGYTLDYVLVEDQLLLPSAQFEKTGRYQLKILSEVYGQLLLLFSIKQEESRQE